MIFRSKWGSRAYRSGLIAGATDSEFGQHPLVLDQCLSCSMKSRGGSEEHRSFDRVRKLTGMGTLAGS